MVQGTAVRRILVPIVAALAAGMFSPAALAQNGDTVEGGGLAVPHGLESAQG